MGRWRWGVILVLTIATVGGFWAGTLLEWEWNFNNLEPEGLRSVELQDEIIDKFKLSISFSLLTAENVEDSRALRKKLKEKGHHVVILTSSSGSGSLHGVHVFRRKFVKTDNSFLKYFGIIFNSIFIFYKIFKLSKNSDVLCPQTPILGIPTIIIGHILQKPVVPEVPSTINWIVFKD